MYSKTTQQQQLLLFSVVVAFLACSGLLETLDFLLHSRRLLHLSVSAGCILVATLIREDHKTHYLPEIIAVMSLGLLKELTDPLYDNLDMLANLLGCGLGLGVALTLGVPAARKKYQLVHRRN